MKSLGLVLVLAIATAASAGQDAPTPAGVVSIDAAGASMNLWPYTTTNFLPEPNGASDPVNLVFLDTDPRAVRQALLTLDGARPAWSYLPSGAKECVWMDGMGYEQAAYVEPEGWVGSEVQLVCATPQSPLGREYRFHVRLFRSGPHTVGAAHFEINIPGTAEHEVLSWEMARSFVADDMARLAPGAFLGEAAVFTPVNGAFRTARGLINGYVWQTNLARGLEGLQFLGALKLPPPQPPSFPAVPIYATGRAAVFAPAFTYAPVLSDVTLTDSRMYQVSTNKPFCDKTGVVISGGPLTFTLRTQTNPAGKYQRTYTVSGTLQVTTGSVTQDAVISELHRGMLTDRHGQASEEVSQVLLPGGGEPGQSLNVVFGAGKNDYWVPQENCAIE